MAKDLEDLDFSTVAGQPDYTDLDFSPLGVDKEEVVPFEKESLRSIVRQMVTALPRGIEQASGIPGSVAQYIAEWQPSSVSMVEKYALKQEDAPKELIAYLEAKKARRKKWGEYGARWNRFWQEQSMKGWSAPDPKVMEAKWKEMPVSKFISLTGEAAPPYLAAVGASILTKNPNVGLAIIGTASGGGMYGRLREEGVEPGTAATLAELMAAVEVATESIPFGHLMKGVKQPWKRLATGKATKETLKKLSLFNFKAMPLWERVAVNPALEGVQEILATMGENFLSYFGFGLRDKKPIPAVLKEAGSHLLDNIAESFVAGVGLSLMGIGLTHRKGMTSNQVKDLYQKKVALRDAQLKAMKNNSTPDWVEGLSDTDQLTYKLATAGLNTGNIDQTEAADIISSLEAKGAVQQIMTDKPTGFSPTGYAKSIGFDLAAKDIMETRAIAGSDEAFRRSVDYMRSQVPFIPKDPQAARQVALLTKHVAKGIKSTGVVTDQIVAPNTQYNFLNEWSSAEQAFATAEEKSGVPMLGLARSVAFSSNKGTTDAMAALEAELEATGLSRSERFFMRINEQQNNVLRDWLYTDSPEVRQQLYGRMDENTRLVANAYHRLLQKGGVGYPARNVRYLKWRMWDKVESKARKEIERLIGLGVPTELIDSKLLGKAGAEVASLIGVEAKPVDRPLTETEEDALVSKISSLEEAIRLETDESAKATLQAQLDQINERYYEGLRAKEAAEEKAEKKEEKPKPKEYTKTETNRAKQLNKQLDLIADIKSRRLPDAPMEALAEGRRIQKLGGKPALMDWLGKQTWGTKEHYFMSEPEVSEALSEFIDMAIPDELKPQLRTGVPQRMMDIDLPEINVRRGRAIAATTDNVANSITRHIEKLAVFAEAIDGVEALVENFNKINPSNKDINLLRRFVNNSLHRYPTVPTHIKIPRAVNRLFWRAYFGLNPFHGAWFFTRQMGQNFAYLPSQVSLTEHAKATAQFIKSKAEGNVDQDLLDSFEEFWKNDFSQKRNIYKYFMMMNEEDMAAAHKTSGKAKAVAEVATDFMGKVAPVSDEINRLGIFPGLYLMAKNNAVAYQNGEISFDKLMHRLRLNSQPTAFQNLMLKHLFSGNIKQFAKEYASVKTRNIHGRYDSKLRGLIEQTPGGKTFVGLITFPRIGAEILYQQGLKPMVEGTAEGDYKKAYQGLTTTLRFAIAAALVSSFFRRKLGREAYGPISTILHYTPFDPGASLIFDLTNDLQYTIDKMTDEGRSMKDIAKGVMAVLGGRFEMFFPLAQSYINYYEAKNDVKGVRLWRLILKTAEKQYQFKNRVKFPKEKRTRWEKAMHVLIGAYERSEANKKE
jgi:hypothetical protein